MSNFFRKAVLLRSTFLFVLLLTSMAVWAQQITVKGIVTDAQTKEGIPGVSVRVKNATSGTDTDVNGAYSLQVLPDAVLLFSSVGFDNKEVSVKGQTQLNVTLGFARNYSGAGRSCRLWQPAKSGYYRFNQ